ncbi:mannose-1-phosphate guanylyltransferase [Sphingomonas sabuli]|uniref:Mannose-1-phosphate guanylyltransferase n=1 Tax=Sphingomonas sabuli TaxID=2764186 RepID=A0A7G9L589_9SPHN|nr:sugar phosphate nucleotidyltransferase [Sphingomonas sabuli]QNM83788.1 mannose-1-phosphate guanylyltransferase [Sphingomonas sabuli]
MAVNIHPVLLCGGSGTRLWPRSRPAAPKPFLPLLGETSLFQQALARFGEPPFAPAIVVTGAEHQALAKAQSATANVAEFIIEPEPKQTAAAIAFAAGRLPPDAIMLVCPSDHYIGDTAAFLRTAEQACAVAADGWLVCLGIEPTAPETRFGYIQRGDPLDDRDGAFKVARFEEKPAQVEAVRYVESGNFVWNGGIFAFRAADFLDELRRYRPELAECAARAVADGVAAANEFRPAAAATAEIAAESVDYAVMENSDRVAMVMARMDWSDIGDWNALHAARPNDAAGNSVRGPADLVDCRGVLVDSDGPRVRAIGLDNIVVVIDGDDVLVASAAAAGNPAKPGQ